MRVITVMYVGPVSKPYITAVLSKLMWPPHFVRFCFELKKSFVMSLSMYG